MKLFLLGAILATSFTAGAAAKAPSVTCELANWQTDVDGTYSGGMTAKPVKITARGATATLNGFSLNGTVKPVCAADGGPCRGYELSVTLENSNGTISSGINTPVEAGKYARHSASLVIENQHVWANCDVK
jgi:hypothetical protein